MAIVGATSLFGAAVQLHRKTVNGKAALLYSTSGMLGALIGSNWTHLLSKRLLMLQFGVLMLVVGVLMLRGGPSDNKRGLCSFPICFTVGFMIGVFTEFLGVGGGFLIVPALIMSANFDTRTAAGTSLTVIALNSLTGLVGQLRFVTINPRLL